MGAAAAAAPAIWSEAKAQARNETLLIVGESPPNSMDIHGVGPVVANMVREGLGYKFHWAVADYLQRAARHIASKVDVEQAYAMGKAAVELALKGENAVMPTIVRKSDEPYRWGVGKVALVFNHEDPAHRAGRTSSPRISSSDTRTSHSGKSPRSRERSLM